VQRDRQQDHSLQADGSPHHGQLTLDGITALIEKMMAEKAAMRCEPEKKSGSIGRRSRAPKKPFLALDEVNVKRTAALIPTMPGTNILETHMNVAIARLLPRASAELVTDLDTLASTAIFCGIGLLLSLSS